MNLNDLAKQYGTDKATPGHAYTEIYDLLFRDRRGLVENVLEIGVSQGASLKMWQDYFPNATIYGIDIRTHFGSIGRIKCFVADQSKPEELTANLKQMGNLDLVIDDGSHQTNDQIISLKTIIPFVKARGLYIIEDVRKIDEIKPFLNEYNHWFAVANDTWPAEQKSGSILAIIKK